MSHEGRLYALAAAVLIAVLYGSTYQQFRFFNLADPGGASDAAGYVMMARGEINAEPEWWQYRWLTPAAAALLEPLTSRIVTNDDLAIGLAFYIVNFAFSLVAGLMLFAMLRAIQFSPLASIIGMCAFASSRITVLVTATPMVDAAYFCAVATLIYFTVANQRWLLLLMPVLVLSKDTVLPFMLLPLLTNLRRSPMLWISLGVSGGVYALGSYLIGAASDTSALTVASAAMAHLPDLLPNVRRLITVSGLYDLQNGFSLWLPMAVAGAWLNARHHYREIPAAIVATVPIAFGLALLSGNFGRLFFACFPAVIAYALILLEHVTYAPDVRAS